MLRFRTHPVVEKNFIRIEVDQRLLHDDKEIITLFRNDSEAALAHKLKDRSPCPKHFATYYEIVRKLPGAGDWMTAHPFFLDIEYRSDYSEAELSIWARAALELLSSDGTVQPMSGAIARITKKPQ